jgi:putative transposase
LEPGSAARVGDRAFGRANKTGHGMRRTGRASAWSRPKRTLRSAPALQAAATTSSLLPGKRGREAKAPVLSQDREHLLHSCIYKFYLRLERPSLAALVMEVRRRFAEQGLPTPNYRTIRRRIEALDLRLAIAKREGSKNAREQLGPVAISSLRPERPMEVLQIDHTPVDVIVVDQQKRLPIGRPWLTLAIDIRTRMLAGFHVSLWAPSTISLSLALSHTRTPHRLSSRTNCIARLTGRR